MQKKIVITHFERAKYVAEALNISAAAVSRWGPTVPKQWWETLNVASDGALKIPVDGEFLREQIRQAIHIEGRISAQLSEQGQGGVSDYGSRCLIDNAHFQLRTLSTVINALPTPKLAWVHFCYGAGGNDAVVPCNLLVFENFLACSPSLHDKSLSMVKVLNPLAAQCVKNKINTGKPFFNGVSLRGMTRHTESNWKKNWAPRWRLLKRIWKDFDGEIIDLIDREFAGAVEKQRLT